MTLLARHADNLFWIGRYVERAETQARLLEVGSRNALIPNSSGGFRNEWESILSASGTATGFSQKYGDDIRQRNFAGLAVRRSTQQQRRREGFDTLPHSRGRRQPRFVHDLQIS